MTEQRGTTTVAGREGRRRIIDRCQASGDLPGGLDQKEVLGLLWAHIHGFTLLAAHGALTEDDHGGPDAFLEAGVSVILAGLDAALPEASTVELMTTPPSRNSSW